MDYEAFRHIWLHALRGSRLPTIGLHGTEMLDTRRLDRSYSVHVEPLGGQDAAPFHVTAELSWDWQVTNTVRGSRTDTELLSEMLGRDEIESLETEKPLIRVDIKLRASAPAGESCVGEVGRGDDGAARPDRAPATRRNRPREPDGHD